MPVPWVKESQTSISKESTNAFSLNFQQDTHYLKLLMRSRWHQCLDGYEFLRKSELGDGSGGPAQAVIQWGRQQV